jgi:hypothetical protein
VSRVVRPGAGAIVVVFASLDWPLRESVRDHLLALQRYSRRPCIYLNLAVRRPPRWLRLVPVELIVFHTTFLSKRGTPVFWARLLDRARPLKAIRAVRAALPQDEYLPPAPLCDFIEEFEIDHVFSVAPESVWSSVYPTVDRTRTTLGRALTGYLEPATVTRIERLDSGRERRFDIGYRAKELPAWLGRHARLKTEIGVAFADAAPAHGLSCDISMRPEDALVGEDWVKFLLSCRYTIGVEGGASILDHDGSLRRCCQQVLSERPDAGFEELERRCFPGRDGEFGLVALSPRHLEAVATRTCQVLIDGDYNGVLKPDRHYIPLRRDFSNLDDVLATIRSDDRRAQIVDTAYREIVASGAWSYPRFVEQLQHTTLGTPAIRAALSARAGAAAGRALNALAWTEVVLRLRVGVPLARAARTFTRR